MRPALSERKRFHGWEQQLLELAVFLGKLTHLANDFTLPDGTVVRDSQALPARFRKKRVGRKQPKPSQSVGSVHVRVTSTAPCAKHKAAGKQVGRLSSVTPLASFRATRLARSSRVQAARAAGVEASSLDYWRENRAVILRPSTGLSAFERMNALRARCAARGIAAT